MLLVRQKEDKPCTTVVLAAWLNSASKLICQMIERLSFSTKFIENLIVNNCLIHMFNLKHFLHLIKISIYGCILKRCNPVIHYLSKENEMGRRICPSMDTNANTDRFTYHHSIFYFE